MVEGVRSAAASHVVRRVATVCSSCVKQRCGCSLPWIIVRTSMAATVRLQIVVMAMWLATGAPRAAAMYAKMMAVMHRDGSTLDSILYMGTSTMVCVWPMQGDYRACSA